MSIQSNEADGFISRDIYNNRGDFMWNEETGRVYSIAKDNAPVRGCTVSKAVKDGDNSLIYFSLAAKTDISAEIFPYRKLIIVNEGDLNVYGFTEKSLILNGGECIVTPADNTVGFRSEESCVYTEISIRKDDIMNEAVKAGEIFKLGDLLPYQDGRIVNMDISSNDNYKFVIMSFAAGTGLSEHAAPGEALIFALDGEGVISYEGKDYPIKAGENFSFAKGGMHAVKAEKPFKMALFLTLS